MVALWIVLVFGRKKINEETVEIEENLTRLRNKERGRCLVIRKVMFWKWKYISWKNEKKYSKNKELER